ncbi:MAG: MFS transporter [Candidatus Aenigmarchaeota archaeon]|nr:MFS transporter [Candidatus Aenigmarchaeota archaeon]
MQNSNDRWMYAILPLKVSGAIFSYLIILYSLSLWRDAGVVGLIAFFMTLGNILGSLFWGSLAFKTSKRLRMFFVGFIGSLLSFLTILFFPQKSFFYFSGFLFTFTTSASIFSSIAIIAEEPNMEEKIGKFQSIGGWGWVAGLTLGTLLSLFLDSRVFLTFLVIFLGISSLFSVRLVLEKGIERFVDKLLLSFYLKRFTIRRTFEIRNLKYKLAKLFYGLPSYSLPKISWVLPKVEHIFYHASFFFLFVGFGLVFSQYATYIKHFEFSDSFVFLTSLISSTVSAIFYSHVKAGRYPTLYSMIAFRILMFLMLIVSGMVSRSLMIVLFLVFSLLDGYTWAFLTVLSNVLTIRLSKLEIGINSFFQFFGYAVGSLMSGWLIGLVGFALNFSLAIVFCLISIVFLSIHVMFNRR